MPTTWRALDRVVEEHLDELGGELRIDIDATITIAHSEKKNAAATHTFGFHPLLAFLDRPDVAGGEALAGLLWAGNVGSNTAADHVRCWRWRLRRCPERPGPAPTIHTARGCWPARTRPGRPTRSPVACRERGGGFSFGLPVDHGIQRVVDLIPQACWAPAIDTGGSAG